MGAFYQQRSNRGWKNPGGDRRRMWTCLARCTPLENRPSRRRGDRGIRRLAGRSCRGERPRPNMPAVLRPKQLVAVLALGALAAPAAGCGKDIEVPREEARAREGAVLFKERCAGCHSLDAAAAVGSKPAGQVGGGERTNAPDFNSRRVSADDALFAIRNGGFSGAIMPANIVVGEDAEKVAEFLAAYAGKGGSAE
jgi:mono/diheme cytochrome c family protein